MLWKATSFFFANPGNFSCALLIDFDELNKLVYDYNKQVSKEDPEKNSKNYVRLEGLIKHSNIVNRRILSTNYEHLSELEKLRLHAEERRYQKSIHQVTTTNKDDTQDNVANYKRSLAIGINSLIGIFLTFLGGYWGAEYCGITKDITRLLIGLTLSFSCLLIEVILFILHDESQRRGLSARESNKLRKTTLFCAHQSLSVEKSEIKKSEETNEDKIKDELIGEKTETFLRKRGKF